MVERKKQIAFFLKCCDDDESFKWYYETKAELKLLPCQICLITLNDQRIHSKEKPFHCDFSQIEELKK